jgi:hypothetical protein
MQTLSCGRRFEMKATSQPAAPPAAPPVATDETAPSADPRWWRLLPGSVRAWLKARFGDVEPSIRRGYGLWLTVGTVIAVPEIWAAVARPPWPTISGTVGHLETRWSFVAVVVVAVVVIVATHAIRMPFAAAGPVVEQADGRKLGRTDGGRFTLYPERQSELPALTYILGAIGCVVVGSFIAAGLSDNKWILGYVIYGLIAVFCVIVPSALALGPAPDAPFAGVFATLADLQRRLHFVGVILLTGLVILLIHLAFYPWPDVFRQHPGVDAP